jgi:hypothetical protein
MTTTATKRRIRRPSIRTMIHEAKLAGLNTIGASIAPDGEISLMFAGPGDLDSAGKSIIDDGAQNGVPSDLAELI